MASVVYVAQYFEEPKGYWEKFYHPPKRRVTYPVPCPRWQAREYEALMGHPPPETPEEARWQFEYSPRREASKQAFADFIALTA